MRRLFYQDESRLEYGRMFWRKPERKARLLAHWQDVRLPNRDRFLEKRMPLVDRVLFASPQHDNELDAALQLEGLSLRVVVKEIPLVFGGFW